MVPSRHCSKSMKRLKKLLLSCSAYVTVMHQILTALSLAGIQKDDEGAQFLWHHLSVALVQQISINITSASATRENASA